MLVIRLPESIREALLRHISDMEDFYAAHHVKERIVNGEERTYTLDEVIQDLGFESEELAGRVVRKRIKAVKKAR